MKKAMFVMAALAVTAGMGWMGTWVSAQGTPAPVATKPTLKVGVVNLNMVLKEFKKANSMGESLIKQAQEKEALIKKQEEDLQKQAVEAQKMADPVQKDARIKELGRIQFEMQTQVADHKKMFAKMQSDMAVDVYGNLKQVIDSVAKTQGLELVFTYPDVTDPKEIGKAADAFRILSNQGAMIAWKAPGLDITDTVIATLNHYFPAPAGVQQMSSPPK